MTSSAPAAPAAPEQLEINGNLYNLEALVDLYRNQLNEINEKLIQEAARQLDSPDFVASALNSNSTFQRNIARHLLNQLGADDAAIPALRSSLENSGAFLTSVENTLRDMTINELNAYVSRERDAMEQRITESVKAHMAEEYSQQMAALSATNEALKLALRSVFGSDIQGLVTEAGTTMTAELQGDMATASERLERANARIEQLLQEAADTQAAAAQASADAAAVAEAAAMTPAVATALEATLPAVIEFPTPRGLRGSSDSDLMDRQHGRMNARAFMNAIDHRLRGANITMASANADPRGASVGQMGYYCLDDEPPLAERQPGSVLFVHLGEGVTAPLSEIINDCHRLDERSIDSINSSISTLELRDIMIQRMRIHPLRQYGGPDRVVTTFADQLANALKYPSRAFLTPDCTTWTEFWMLKGFTLSGDQLHLNGERFDTALQTAMNNTGDFSDDIRNNGGTIEEWVEEVKAWM